MPVLLTLSHLGIVPDAGPSLERALTSLRRRRDVLAAPGGPAEEVSLRIGRTIPLVYGATGPDRRRGATLEDPDQRERQDAGVLRRAAGALPPRAGRLGPAWRRDATGPLPGHPAPGRGAPADARAASPLVVDATDEVMASVIPIWAEGDDALGRFFDLALFGDFVSLYMAGREGIDPGPVPAVSDVEAALR